MKIWLKKGYTLAEVVIVILIITAVVSVTIKITKVKLDSILSYQYYNAYATLNAFTREMLLNFKDNYIDSGDRSGCEDGKEINNTIDGEDQCVLAVKTLPRTGLCNVIANYVNTVGNDCSGTTINSGTTDFSSSSPDITLRNGIRIYNLGADPLEINDLNGNKSGESIHNSIDVNNTNTFGYTIYVDIDGSSGPSTLWEDVYPFYLTLSGQVVPAIGDDGIGGNDRSYLQVSVEKEKVEGDTRINSWITKSDTFKNAACISNTITGNYCGDTQVDDECEADNADCRMKVIIPYKLF